MILRKKRTPNPLPSILQKLVPKAQLVDIYVANDLAFLMGTVIDTGMSFFLSPAHLAVHMAVLGGSGSGKSKFLELLFRHCLVNGKAFGLWDPHGDLAKSLLAFVAAQKARGNDLLWRKIHYLELTPDCVFSFDPAERAPRRAEAGDYAYYQWLKTRVDRVVKVLLRLVSEANQQIMVRLRRWLRCVVTACLVAIDDKNTHMGLNKALIFTDPQHQEFPALYATVEPHLPMRVRRNFEKLIATKRAQDQEKWVESTINKLEDALSPLTEAVYSQTKPSIDIKGIIDRGEFLVIDLKETEYFSHDEKLVLGGLLFVEVLAIKQAEENVPEEDRKEFIIGIDEVGELLADDIERALGATRKYKCPMVLGAQDLSTFARGDFDMAAKVLTMCGTIACFQNTYREDKKYLADRVFSGNLDLFTKRMVEVQRQRGDRILKVVDMSRSRGGSENWSKTHTVNEGESHAHQIGQALAIANTHSSSEMSAEGLSHKGSMLTSNGSRDDIHSRNKTKGDSRSGSETSTKNASTTNAKTHGTADANMYGGGSSWNVTEAEKTVILPNIVSEFEDDGTLEHGTPDLQRARHEQRIHVLGVGQVAMAVRGRQEAFIVQVDSVEEWWPDGRTKLEAIRRMKERIQALQPYFFAPPKTSAIAVSPALEDVDDGVHDGGDHDRAHVDDRGPAQIDDDIRRTQNGRVRVNPLA